MSQLFKYKAPKQRTLDTLLNNGHVCKPGLSAIQSLGYMVMFLLWKLYQVFFNVLLLPLESKELL